MITQTKTDIPTKNSSHADGQMKCWTPTDLAQSMFATVSDATAKATDRLILASDLLPQPLKPENLQDECGRPVKTLVLDHVLATARKKRNRVLFLQLHRSETGQTVVFANDARLSRMWFWLEDENLTIDSLRAALHAFTREIGKDVVFIPSGQIIPASRLLARQCKGHRILKSQNTSAYLALEIYHDGPATLTCSYGHSSSAVGTSDLTHLDRLEAESIHIIREVMAEAENPVMLYSVGKDSSVMLHLARKAFYPSPPPFPLMHVDTLWKFQSMYDFRNQMAEESGMDLITYANPDGAEKDINPFVHGSAYHTDVMKTQGLKQALDKYGFDVAFGGARRDEEKSRAKERVFSFRTTTHSWDPKNQRPELWNLYNGLKSKGESIRVFPLSNWTELDIWQYIYRENIPIVPLYFAADRPVVNRNGLLLMVDDNRLQLLPGEEIQIKKVRFRTLGCYPLTGAIESDADDMASIVLELLNARTSERQGRAIDADSNASMEQKKQEGYF